VLPAWDQQNALEKLIWLINHPAERQALGKRAKEWSDKNLLTWEERANIEIQYYQSVIGNQ
jgi:glycosyltransferase involved in cell wall biosynthesis